MSIPSGDVPVTVHVRQLAAGARLTPVWRNDLGGVTFRAEDAAGVRFIKFGPHTGEASMADEAERLRWASPFVAVPVVIERGQDAEHEWMVTEALPGQSAVTPRWVAEPAKAVKALGEGLRSLHDRLPVAECPYSWQVDKRIRDAAARGIRVPDDLMAPPPTDLLVVCHGDACAPNTLLDDDGHVTGHVDLGALGVADRWADIAVAAMSTEWNYGPGWQRALVESYGVPFDAARMDYYQRLWNAM